MKRMIWMAVVGALLLVPGTSGARARCESKLTVWSGNFAIVSGMAPGITCVTGSTQNIDTNLIYGDTIMVTHDGPYFRGRPFIMTFVSGLGFKREATPLVWVAANKRYESRFLDLPYGAQSNGCLTVSLRLTERRGKRVVTTYSDAQRYHTLGVNC